MAQRNALAGFWTSSNNFTGVPADKYRRCWPFHLAMAPFYYVGPATWIEPAGYALSGLCTRWIRAKLRSSGCPKFDVAQAIMGFGTELFDGADRVGALKVVDCPNTHPVTYYGFWQREYDLWCPGEKVPIPQWFYARMNRELERADVILCPSLFVKESMVLNGIPEHKCFVNPFGVDISIFKKRETVPARPRFVCVGTICLRKGHQYLFRAFQEVKKTVPNAELICVGGPGWDFYREWPRWKGTFTHYPNLPHADLAALLRTCTAFVFPSQEEGLPRAQIEAMASGLPVIGTHPGGATTLVQDGVEGFIVNGRNPQEIAAAMIRIARDPSLNKRMGDAAYVRGGAQNSWLDYSDRLLAEYARRLELGHGGAKAVA
jgi:glycosyltransferase involved in cell wall biosynthesis